MRIQHYLPFVLCTLLLAVNVSAREKLPKPPLGIPAFADPAKEGIDPKLPNVLIIGDSISIDYTPHVAKMLEGKANVFHCGGRWGANATSTSLALSPIKGTQVRHIDAWCAFRNIKKHPLVTHPGYPKMAIHHPTIDYSAYGLKWDVITCNWGMWDIIRGGKPGAKPEELARMTPRDPATPLDTYSKRLEQSFGILKETGAKVFWVSTTPIDEGVPNARLRQDTDAVEYNAAATKVANAKDVGIIDLHTPIKPKIDASWRRSGKLGDVHFSPEASNVLAEIIVEAIQSHLKPKS